MNDTAGIIDFLAKSSQIHIPVLRFALRWVIATDSICDQLNDDDERLLRIIAPALVWPESMRKALCEKYAALVPHHLAQDSDPESLCKLLLTNPVTLWSAYAREVYAAWKREPHMVQQSFRDALAMLESDELRQVGEDPCLAHVATAYGLTRLERDVLQYALSAKNWFHFKKFLRSIPMASTGDAWSNLAAMIGCSRLEIESTLSSCGNLQSSRLIWIDSLPDHMEEFVGIGPVAARCIVSNAQTYDEVVASLLKPMPPPGLALTDFPHLAEEAGWIADRMKSAVATRESGVHILLHGAAGLGKSQFARILVTSAGLCGFEAKGDNTSAEPDVEVAGRLERFGSGQRLLRTHAGACMIVEGLERCAKHAENLLTDALDTSGTPTIWICEDCSKVSPSILRRFAVHLKMRQPPLSSRRQLAAKVMDGSETDLGDLDAIAAQSEVSPAQIVMASRFSRLSSDYGSTARIKALKFALEASREVQGQAPTAMLKSAHDRNWDLNALNLETSAPLARIMEGLRRTQCASLVFHGVPGTGKTSMAAYIADAIDRPLLTRRVSELASRWIGETEKSIADMFREAATEKAVLLLDEADSFLCDRNRARSPWEITQVNEILQQMDSFGGVFICATNLVKSLDAAALRRFTFKIKFLPLDSLHRTRMLGQFAMADPDAVLPQSIAERLSVLSQLAPGDFATVRRQEILVDQRFSLESWIAALEREHEGRSSADKRRPAFV